MLVGRLSTSRAVGKGVFFLLRQSLHTIQGVMFQGEVIDDDYDDYGYDDDD
jgi:hypothetical protein